MAIILASIGNMAAGATNASVAHASTVAQPLTADAIYWPAWILVGGVLIALLIVIGVLGSIKAALTAKPKKRDEDFTRMVCKQVWKHTDVIKGTFHERLRQPQSDVVTLRVLLRLLREDLAAPVGFIERMRGHAPADWPSYELFAAFDNWAGKVSAIESQLADMQQMLSYPAVREPVDTHRDQMLVHYYTTEQAPLGYSIGQVITCAIAICAEGEPILEKAQSGGFWPSSGHDNHNSHSSCPACDGAPHTAWVSNDPRLILIVPPAAPAKRDKKEEPKHQACFCVVPQACHCVPASCACICSCKSAKPEAAAHH
ncbi:hypothetical protein P6144_02665 [Sphingomonas sp. HITSZ_GF]|uniref:hypothetical protein n=1 Tax=Sphingomonas sp. HITSZ_GF TaxID=3037247 RepID=UPI00240DB029|nr:hypothetical protein [Sphingomonas sp. HITSZ_GF]MDG2532537.1 hypothetical protein [Sphingomonas sp. HITSZ_GF]